jgi:precorrin-6B methylase 2
MEQTTTTFKISESPAVKAQLTPDHIMQVGLGFWASKTLLAAVKFQIFTILAEKPLNGIELRERLKLHERSYDDFFDALVSLNFLRREDEGALAVYSNAPESNLFLDKRKPGYLGGILEMSNRRLYQYWGNLEEGLITGQPQNEIKESKSENQFKDLYSNPNTLKEFLLAMAGIQLGAFKTFTSYFDFSIYKSVCDAGGAIGALSVEIAKNHPHLKCISYDLPEVASVAKEYINQHGLTQRVEVASGDFFENIPNADVVVMGNILHDWSENDKLLLIKKAYEALPEGGALVCIENVIDDERRKNTFGLLMSLNMLIETKEGKDYTFKDFTRWVKRTGFTRSELVPLVGPTSAAIAYK